MLDAFAMQPVWVIQKAQYLEAYHLMEEGKFRDKLHKDGFLIGSGNEKSRDYVMRKRMFYYWKLKNLAIFNLNA